MNNATTINTLRLSTHSVLYHKLRQCKMLVLFYLYVIIHTSQQTKSLSFLEFDSGSNYVSSHVLHWICHITAYPRLIIRQSILRRSSTLIRDEEHGRSLTDNVEGGVHSGLPVFTIVNQRRIDVANISSKLAHQRAREMYSCFGHSVPFCRAYIRRQLAYVAHLTYAGAQLELPVFA